VDAKAFNGHETALQYFFERFPRRLNCTVRR